jgi:hypothetical protein
VPDLLNQLGPCSLPTETCKDTKFKISFLSATQTVLSTRWVVGAVRLLPQSRWRHATSLVTPGADDEVEEVAPEGDPDGDTPDQAILQSPNKATSAVNREAERLASQLKISQDDQGRRLACSRSHSEMSTERVGDDGRKGRGGRVQ